MSPIVKPASMLYMTLLSFILIATHIRGWKGEGRSLNAIPTLKAKDQLYPRISGKPLVRG